MLLALTPHFANSRFKEHRYPEGLIKPFLLKAIATIWRCNAVGQPGPASPQSVFAKVQVTGSALYGTHPTSQRAPSVPPHALTSYHPEVQKEGREGGREDDIFPPRSTCQSLRTPVQKQA